MSLSARLCLARGFFCFRRNAADQIRQACRTASYDLAVPLAMALYGQKETDFLAIVAAWMLGWLTVMLSLSKGAFLAGIAGHIVVFPDVCSFPDREFVKRPPSLPESGWRLRSACRHCPPFRDRSRQLRNISPVAPSRREAARRCASLRGRLLQRWQRTTGWSVSAAIILGPRSIQREASERKPVPGFPEIVDYFAVERSHNEPLQIIAELDLSGSYYSRSPLERF